MADKRLVIDGFGQVELNQVSFRRDGRIEAQCALDATDFASVPAENGMLLAVDRVNRTVKFPTAANAAKMPIALNYTTEHMYESTYADEDALAAATTATALATTPLYGGISNSGAIKVSATKPSVGPVLLVVEKTTMPDGQFALKFQVLEA